MAKKSNKTEHVLKLITKDEGRENAPEISAIVKTPETSSLTYETTLKIEIEPEITVKPKAQTDVGVPVKLEEKAEEKIPETTPETAPIQGESAFIEEHRHLVNLAEIFVKEKLQGVMKRMNVCGCSVCSNDVMAMALNSLPTRYVTTDSGKQYLQLESYKKQFETDVLSALTKACVRVKASPRHDI